MFGRKKILTDESEVTAENVVEILQYTYFYHLNNCSDIQTLYNEYKGDQDILGREKEIRPDICNKIVENHANEIVTFKTGYLCGEPIQYVSRGSDDTVTEAIATLNDMMVLCGKDALDDELTEWVYICGQGYRMIWPNDMYVTAISQDYLKNKLVSFNGDDSPFEIYTLDPRYCYTVYNSGLGEKPIANIKYIVRVDESVVFSVYTPYDYYEITMTPTQDRMPQDPEFQFDVRHTPSTLGYLPVTEYYFNNARLGIFEIVDSILKAINTVQSNRVDGVEQFVQSIIVLYNCDIDEATAKVLREAGLVKLKSVGENKADIKEIAEQLDQTQVQKLIDYMYQTILNIIGMPNRNGGTSTSDTGTAVIMRDGWESAEARAKRDETAFKRSERTILKNVLKILRDTVGTPLKLSDIDIKFTRRNYSELQSKVQALDTMLKNPLIAPIIAYTHCGMFSDPEDACKQGLAYKDEQAAALAVQNANVNPTPNSNPNGGDASAG